MLNDILLLPSSSFQMHTDIITNELTWLLSKKKTHLSELQEFEAKTQEQVCKLIEENVVITNDRKRLSNELSDLEINYKQMQESFEKKISNLKDIVGNYETENNEVKNDLDTKTIMISENEDTIYRNQRYITELEANIKDLESRLNSQQIKHEQEIATTNIANNENIERMIKKYEDLIQEKVKGLENKYEEELLNMRNNNKNIIHEIETKSKQSLENTKEQIKRNTLDGDRVLEENRKLLTNLNELKRKILNLEHELETGKQENKITLKEKELMAINLKREVECLRESKDEYEDKIKKLKQTNSESQWAAKQSQIEKDSEIKKIKALSEEIMDELSNKHKIEIEEYKAEILSYKNKNNELNNKNDDLIKERDSIKQVVDFLKKEKESSKTSKPVEDVKETEKEGGPETELYQLRSLVSELKKDMVRKNAEIEVLKEEIARLKTKANKISTAYQENVKINQEMEKENKMLLSEIVFLRDKNKSKAPSNDHDGKGSKNEGKFGNRKSKILDMESEESMNEDDLHAEIEMYKNNLALMQDVMGKTMKEAADKIDEKNTVIEKQKAIIARLERELYQ